MFNQQGGPGQQLPQTNLIAAMVLIGLMYVAFIFLFPQPVQETAQEQGEQTQQAEAESFNALTQQLTESAGGAGTATIESRAPDGHVVSEGQIDVSSGMFAGLTLNDYKETLDDGSANVSLFSFDQPGRLDYVLQPIVQVETASGRQKVDLNFTQVSTSDGSIKLQSQASDDLQILLEYIPKGEHLYHVRLTALNEASASKGITLGARLLRGAERDINGDYSQVPGVQTIWTARQGLAFFEDGRVKRQAYNQVADSTGDLDPNGNQVAKPGGSDWIAMADKYFMVALIRNQSSQAATSYNYIAESGYFAARLNNSIGGQGVAANPGVPLVFEFDMFAGPKELSLLRQYEADLGAEQFAFTIDFGWFWYFTMPFTAVLAWLGGILGNFGLAILAITVVIKLILFPLANNAYRSMARMKKLQPKMEALREQHGDDRQAMSQATMALYREEGANPIAGCLPMVVQIPIFFALYKVIFNTIEIRHEPFFGWIQDMSVGDPTSWINLFGLLPYDVPSIFAVGGLLGLLSVGIWPILMGLTMVWQQRLSPAPADPTQAMVMRFLPIIFTFFMATFAAGLVIYWTWNNFLSVLQQMFIMRGTKTESEEKKQAEVERQKEKAAKKGKKS